jgi:hypothetical protein
MTMWNTIDKDAHRIPSSSEDFIFANITSDANGLNTTILNTTAGMYWWHVTVSSCCYVPLYHKNPSPYLTFPSPASTRSNTQMHSPTSCSTRFAYFLLTSDIRACSVGIPKFEGWTATVSCVVRLFVSH